MLSESVSKALTLSKEDKVKETAKLCNIMDKFFDALNYTHGYHARKQFQQPYIGVEWISVSK